MTVSVIVPYAGECEHRARAWEWIRPTYETLGYEVVIGYGDPDAWSKADAVADGLKQTDGDLLVIADADCYAEQLPAAVAWTESGRGWAVPYRKVYRLSETSSEAVSMGVPLTRDLKLDPHHKGGGYHEGIVGGGIVVLPRTLYEECPLDRRFVGWGGEDHAFGYALRTIGGEPLRKHGLCWHFWHPPQPHPQLTGVCSNPFNERLRLEYRAAYKAKDVAAMRRLIGDGMEGNQTVIIRRRNYMVDAYGDPIENPTETQTVRALVAPRAEPEIVDRGRAGFVEGLTVYLDADVLIDHDDQVTVNGDLYEVDGRPALWVGATLSGIQVELRRAVG